jgi:hypothetical protein
MQNRRDERDIKRDETSRATTCGSAPCRIQPSPALNHAGTDPEQCGNNNLWEGRDGNTRHQRMSPPRPKPTTTAATANPGYPSRAAGCAARGQPSTEGRSREPHAALPSCAQRTSSEGRACAPRRRQLRESAASTPAEPAGCTNSIRTPDLPHRGTPRVCAGLPRGRPEGAPPETGQLCDRPRSTAAPPDPHHRREAQKPHPCAVPARPSGRPMPATAAESTRPPSTGRRLPRSAPCSASHPCPAFPS